MGNSKTEITDTKEEMPLPLSDARALLEIIYLINAILQNAGNLSRAAEELGIGRRTLYDLMEKHGISYTDGKLSIELNPILIHIEVQSPLLEHHN